MISDEGRAAAKKALAAFTDAVSDAEWRGRFAQEPDAALEERNIEAGDIPDQVLDFLKSLSEEELRVVANLGAVMIEAGLSEDVRDERGFLFWHF